MKSNLQELRAPWERVDIPSDDEDGSDPSEDHSDPSPLEITLPEIPPVQIPAASVSPTQPMSQSNPTSPVPNESNPPSPPNTCPPPLSPIPEEEEPVEDLQAPETIQTQEQGVPMIDLDSEGLDQDGVEQENQNGTGQPLRRSARIQARRERLGLTAQILGDTEEVSFMAQSEPANLQEARRSQ